MRRSTPLLTGLMAALIAALAATSPSLATTPPRQIALGISEPGWAAITDPNPNNNALDAVTEGLGRQPAIWSLWSDWGDLNSTKNHQATGPFPTDLVAALNSKGVVPQIYWEPVDPANPDDCAHWQLSNIIAGDHDQYIQDWAEAAKASQATIILRFAHEMNGYWYIWGNQRCNNTAKKFRQAWKHVWNIFHNVGATNVKFEYSIINTQYVTADYPGNSYVDYLGLTALDWGKKKKWKPLVTLMTPAMTALRQLSKTKPIIAAEIAAGNNPNCVKCDKVAFFSQGYAAAVATWSQLVAIVYFDYDMRSQGQDDWRLQSPQAALDAYKNLLTQTQFQGTFPPS